MKANIPSRYWEYQPHEEDEKRMEEELQAKYLNGELEELPEIPFE